MTGCSDSPNYHVTKRGQVHDRLVMLGLLAGQKLWQPQHLAWQQLLQACTGKLGAEPPYRDQMLL